MKTLRSVLAWADSLLNGAVLGTLGGVLLAHTCDAIQAQQNLSLWLIGMSLTALSSSAFLDL